MKKQLSWEPTHTGRDTGTWTPWGNAQYAYRYERGVTCYGTAGHGGFKLSPLKNRLIPEELRNEDGWYEEDCEAYKVMAHFPITRQKWDSEEEVVSLTRCWEQIRRWFPEQYKKISRRYYGTSDFLMEVTA